MTTVLERPTRGGASPRSAPLAAVPTSDPAAWQEVVHRHTRMLWSLAASFDLDADDSADVVQSTWLQLAEQPHRLRDTEALSGWLVGTARRQCLRLLRERRRERVSVVEAATALSVPVGSTGPTRSRGLARLRGELAVDGPDDLR